MRPSLYKPFFLVLACLLALLSSNAQIDTFALKAMVERINTEREHVEFWDYIFERDQNKGRRNDHIFLTMDTISD